MKKFITFLLIISLNAGCKQKEISGPELDNKLKETMRDYLHKTLQPGTEVTIKDVVYYPEKVKKQYICEFKVNMKLGKSDTTGIITALISNDFSTVTRTQ